MNKRTKFALLLPVSLVLIPLVLVTVLPMMFVVDTLTDGVPHAWRKLKAEGPPLADFGRIIAFVVTGVDYLKRKEDREHEEWLRSFNVKKDWMVKKLGEPNDHF